MKNIKLVSLELSNFKCHKYLKLDFQGRNASLLGDNATGKSSIYDAFCWLLFGRDSLGNGEKNMDIKPLNAEGDVADHHAITAVEAVLTVDGEELVLKRTYKEVWSTKRGASEPSFDGHVSDYSVNGVPVQKKGFADKVAELVDEEVFRSLTDVRYFAAVLPWQERRGILFDIAGVLEDKEILATSEKFLPLIESMGRLSLEDYEKKLLAEKRQLMGAKTDIPARISECQKTIDDVAGLDFAAAKAAVAEFTAEKDRVAAELLSIENSNAAEQKDIEIREAKLELSTLEAENRTYRDRQLAAGVDIYGLSSRITALQVKLSQVRTIFARENDRIKDLDGRIATARENWLTINAESFAGGICSSCGQQLTGEALQAAMETFELDKKRRLRAVEDAAEYHKNAKAAAEERLARSREDLQQLEEEINALQAQIDAAEDARTEPQDMPDYAERKAAIEKRIHGLNAELFGIQNGTAGLKRELRQKMSEIDVQIAAQMEIVSKESLLTYTRERIGQLREEAQNAAQCLGAIEKMLYLIEAYTRYKTRFVEESVNGQFRLAKFRLFREQANGGVEERCDAVHDGVPYGSVNNGMKINLGVDIINTLSRHYGVLVPLFVDNAESVTRLENSDTQVIRLEVKKEDKELRVNYENS